MKKMMSVISGLALVTAFSMPAMAQPEELDVNAAALAANSAIAQDDSQAMADNDVVDVDYSKTVDIDKDTDVDVNQTYTKTTDIDVDKTYTKTVDTDVDVDASQSVDVDKTYSKTVSVDESQCNSNNDNSDSSNSHNNDNDTTNTTTVSDSNNDNSDNSVNDSFKVTDAFKSEQNDNILVEASLVQVSANVLGAVGTEFGTGYMEVENEIDLCNVGNSFTGISNINLSSGYLNNAAAQVTIGMK